MAFSGGNGKGLGLFLQSFDLFLNILPHVPVENEGKLTKRTIEEGTFIKVSYQIFGFSATDWAGKREFVFH